MRREQRPNKRGRGRSLALIGALVLACTGSGTAFAGSTNPIAAQEWALNMLNATKIRQQFHAYGAGVLVAVIDSGVDPDQPDLQGRLVDGVNLVDPTKPNPDFGDTANPFHGTAVSTVIAGHPHKDSGGNDYGMIGLADQAKIMPIKIGNGEDTMSDPQIIAGINYAVAHGAQVINMSIGSAGIGISDPAVTSAINAALAHGIVVVVAAGNDAKTGDNRNEIAVVPGVLDVGGTDSNGQKFADSHFGVDVNIAAPAKDIEVGVANGKYANNYSGTSFAAPWVSGEAALLIAEHPTWTSGQIVATIIDNTIQSAGGQTKPGQRVDDNVGYGVIDPVAALGAAEPASKANPLGGPATTSKPGASGSTSAGATSTGGAGATTATATGSSRSSSAMPLIIGIGAAVVLLAALLIFLLVRRKRNGGGKGGPGGGGGNAYYPPQGAGYPQPGGYGQQGAYPPPGGYGQQQGGNGQRGGYPPQVGRPPQGGYGQPGQQNPYGTQGGR